MVAYAPTRQGKQGTFAIVIQGDVQHRLWQREPAAASEPLGFLSSALP
jgi:hypothetical protein